MDPTIVTLLEKSGADGVPFRARPNHVHHTWAKTFHSLPELYIQPESLEEIEKVVNLARKHRRRLVTVGCGHSPSHITCTSSWQLNLDNYNRILSVDESTGLAVLQSGIRLYALCDELERRGLAMPNLGSINQQSIAGAISTGTHGSSLSHGLMSEDVVALKITLANGKTEPCSRDENPSLFRAALLSLGALGIITEVTFRAVPAFTLRWTQTIDTDLKMFSAWTKDLWTQSEFVRVWWFPYTRRAVVWKAEKTDEAHVEPPKRNYDGPLGYYIYHNLLYVAQHIPRVLPWVEWFVFGMQYGFGDGSTISAVQPSRKALLMNCLYSQYVNEWAIPLHKGPEALRRLSSWLNHLTPEDPDYVPHRIPFSADGLYVHAPVEVRVSDTSLTSNARPYLDPTCLDGPTLYLNATLYRPYHADPPCRERYYEAFEWLMRDLGGKPHWAKNFVESEGIEAFYGNDLQEWRSVRDEADPEGMFVGQWHREKVLGKGPRLALEEVEVERAAARGGGLRVAGVVGESQ
ncbi:D-arabinono-1,4-lactone oxidase [Colletotrichum tofieldiae]|uniref:D-arabinono-1,4-lactone oxidase n=1 Tax=Colletotrichum tofieldiae TaxID=708197 RepID=A0A166NFL8_9PEZI|nr:D-arabinono-1,4-lactone oxidase [Colletotrichum tofieldiae]GKT62624.1 D-arabinono-1,4-lactone oxidase [Colletotrichum tofieldiae]GKT69331.1 D-arabinono-1,4-lactone oxidase [Colletotrichum tofieldiae]